MKQFTIVAKTMFGLEEILAKEITDIGGEEIEILSRAVKFKGDKELLYKANLHLRTAIKILKPIATFQTRDENQLYERIQSINWSKYLSVNKTFSIDGITSGEIFTHSKYVALKTKDAIVDQFRDKYNKRPSIDLDNPHLRLNIHIYNTTCTVSLDSTGMTLAKRGYRLQQTTAPMNEALAAGLVLMSGWDKKRDFFDPMCGSGTIDIEAALIARNIAPSRLRHFTFKNWENFDPELWAKVKEEANDNIKPFRGKIIGHDLDYKAVEIAQQNAQRAGVRNVVEFKINDFFKPKTEVENSHIIFNPPYGERIQAETDMIPFYKEIGTQLKHTFNGCDAWIFSGNLDAVKFIGLHPSKKIKMYNAAIECKFQKYELYSGSKKEK